MVGPSTPEPGWLFELLLGACLALLFAAAVLAPHLNVHLHLRHGGQAPSFNSGVFALRVDSPVWSVWRDILAGALERGADFLVEQQALNVGIREGSIAAAANPREANFICVYEPPWLNEDTNCLTLPQRPEVTIGVVHLTTAKRFAVCVVPTFRQGESVKLSLRFRDGPTASMPRSEAP
jgi:hypothetical protein